MPFHTCKKLKDKQETNKQIHEYQAQQLEELQKEKINNARDSKLKDGKATQKEQLGKIKKTKPLKEARV